MDIFYLITWATGVLLTLATSFLLVVKGLVELKKLDKNKKGKNNRKIQLLTVLLSYIISVFCISYLSFFFLDRDAFKIIARYNLYQFHIPIIVIVFILAMIFLFRKFNK